MASVLKSRGCSTIQGPSKTYVCGRSWLESESGIWQRPQMLVFWKQVDSALQALRWRVASTQYIKIDALSIAFARQ
eukprot:5345489-Pyramimonas_sp.AAC.1